MKPWWDNHSNKALSLEQCLVGKACSHIIRTTKKKDEVGERSARGNTSEIKKCRNKMKAGRTQAELSLEVGTETQQKGFCHERRTRESTAAPHPQWRSVLK